MKLDKARKFFRSRARESREDRTPFYRSERFWSITLAVIFLLTAVGISSYLRLSTVNLGVTDEWAEANIHNAFISQASAQIKQQFPTLPDQSIQAEAETQWQQYRVANKGEIEQAKESISQQLKGSFQFETGKEHPYNQTYVLEMDPYLWWHLAKNYAETGSWCDPGSVHNDDGTCQDVKRLAPVGANQGFVFHVWLEAQAIKIFQGINSNLDSLTIVFFVPVFLAGLAVIPAFFIGRKLAGNIGGFVAAVILAAHPLLINRTTAGFADTDGYNFLFPLLILWVLFEMLDAKRWWTRLSLAALAGVLTVPYALAFGGWWFTLFVFAVSALGYALFIAVHEIVRTRRKGKPDFSQAISAAAAVGVFVLVASIGLSLVLGVRNGFGWILLPFSFSVGLQAATSGLSGSAITGWPNILTTVAELNTAGMGTIIANLGGKYIVLLATVGFFLSMINPRTAGWRAVGVIAGVTAYYLILITKGLNLSPVLFLALYALPLLSALAYALLVDTGSNVKYAVIMLGWLIASFYATTKGIRFLMLGVPPFAIGFGVTVGWLFIAVTNALGKKKPLLVKAAVGFVLLALVLNPAASYSPLVIGKQASKGQLPGMNDAWWEAMRVIRETTPQDTIITSWWDFGHWFRNIGERGVTFDGGSQNPEPGHWVGKILLTPDEKQALGILRMLDCGQNLAYVAARNTLEPYDAKMLIDSIVLQTKAQATKTLAATTIPAADQAEILARTHCTPPPAVFITSSDMIGKAGVWGHFGSWNFQRSLTYEYARQYPAQEAIKRVATLNLSDAQATTLYYEAKALKSDGDANTWISGWPTYVTQNWIGCSVSNATVACPVYMGIAQTQQGTVAVETVSWNVNKPGNATIDFGVYNNGARLGGAPDHAARVVLADLASTKMTSYTGSSQVFTLGLLIRAAPSGNSTSYSILLADPLQIDSLFTQLYFLDGVFTPHFTKLTRQTEPGGGIITVWNVTWPAD